MRLDYDCLWVRKDVVRVVFRLGLYVGFVFLERGGVVVWFVWRGWIYFKFLVIKEF